MRFSNYVDKKMLDRMEADRINLSLEIDEHLLNSEYSSLGFLQNDIVERFSILQVKKLDNFNIVINCKNDCGIERSFAINTMNVWAIREGDDFFDIDFLDSVYIDEAIHDAGNGRCSFRFNK